MGKMGAWSSGLRPCRFLYNTGEGERLGLPPWRLGVALVSLQDLLDAFVLIYYGLLSHKDPYGQV